MVQKLLQTIEENMAGFSKGQRAIAKYIIENYEKAAYMTAASLGSQTGVSESTVVRFALKLGFEGYPEMQRALQELTRTKLTSVQRMEVTNTLIGNADILAKVLLSDIDKIRRTLDEIDREVFYRAVDKIATARNIYIIGVRTSASLAGFLNFSLKMIFDNVRLIQTTSGSEIFEQLLSMEKEDVMIAISFPRYSKRIINAVAFARSRGAVVIALTDSAKSPIAGYADQLLTACSDMASFVDSLVAPLSIINAMIVALTRKKSDELKERLRELEKIWDEYDVYDKNS
ncbi:MAG: MurR/RpiR family transcriptional regulator [Clostridiales bacterium]|nr:MurR/RpiR family transcriptional regulator [Clostridiales bacterium]